jgi:cyclopropane-fatty-acyl-phospholipid synthase
MDELARDLAPPGLFDIEKRLVRRQMALLGDPPLTIRLSNGSTLYRPRERSVGVIIIRDRRTLLRFAIHPELHFGDSYCEGTITVEGDLIEVLKSAFRSIAKAPAKGGFNLSRTRGTSRPRPNTVSRSKKNIQGHYDIGNDFYRLWLDENMQYTCAYFPAPAMGLEQAQTAKMDHVCRKLMLKPGETVVEAGCGWGTLALHMARHYGVTVKAYNISREQVLGARERARAEGLESRVQYIEDDYRNARGRFDVFVSVGMLEHVGRVYYRELGRVIGRSLNENGRGLVHSIGRNRPEFMNAWLERRIFPGAYSPTLREMMDIFEPSGFSVLDVENLRLHYARTLEHWLERFERVRPRVAAMFDEKFVRAWRLYLAGSIAAFSGGDLQLFQVLFARPDKNDLPWSRAHLYQKA